ncbi:MAG: hypothetical protein GC160_02910 [Acidobacteria bacterium]|nr:hypothetical protein [Acidobacteriota bacterium]
MPMYRVTSAIKHQGRVYEEGQVVELPAELAARLHVEPLQEGTATLGLGPIGPADGGPALIGESIAGEPEPAAKPARKGRKGK